MPGTHPDTGAPVNNGDCVCYRRVLYCWDDALKCWRNTLQICNGPPVTNAPKPICGESATD
jgi:hypothetical protein